LREAHKQAVEEGYDRVAEHYLATKDADDPITPAELENLTRGLPSGAAVLDLGCGAGVDVSARQLELASRHVPAAELVKADMTSLDFEPASFDAVVAFHSIIHVPRAEHPALLEEIQRWLRPGGAFLATWALGAWEGEEEGWGAPMRWSHYDGETSLALLREAGFATLRAEARTTRGARGDETWLWVLAQKGG
jgi:SAM-dependent methyltransferase